MKANPLTEGDLIENVSSVDTVTLGKHPIKPVEHSDLWLLSYQKQ
jgi:hypothetical protein